MNSFLLDASALVQRYALEAGTARMNRLFQRAPRDRLRCLMLGAAEVVAALVRKRNGGRINSAVYASAVRSFRAEVLDAADFTKLAVSNALVNASIAFLDSHSVNSSDAVLLQAALDEAANLRSAGNDLVVVASDRRLLRAAQAEGLPTFDPETQSQADLDVLL
jgi:predicted nucleic acid-binding protein